MTVGGMPPTVIQLPCYLEVVTHLVEEEFLLGFFVVFLNLFSHV